MTKLLGTKPNQAPINADLGDLAYQDGANSQIGPITVTGGNVGIGRTPTTNLLEVAGTIESTGALVVQSSISATSADADLTAGGNRTYADFSGSVARLGGTDGGGSAIQVGLYAGSNPVLLTDSGSTNKLFYGAQRFGNGMAVATNDIGSYSANLSISYTDVNSLFVELGASIDINFTSLGSHRYAKVIDIEQSAGAYTPTFKVNTATTNVRWRTTEPNWSGLADGVVVRVACEVDHDGYLQLWAEEDVRA